MASPPHALAPLASSSSSGANGSVASRFVSSDTLDAARKKREEDWKALHEKLGQEPPPAPDQEYDPRSLYEQLQAHRDTKQSAFEEKLKFKNQWQYLDQEDVDFLNRTEEEKREERWRKGQEAQEELDGFRKAVAASRSSDPQPSTSSVPPAPATAAPKPATALPPKPNKKKKDFQKTFLAGAIKRPSATSTSAAAGAGAGAGKRKPVTDAAEAAAGPDKADGAVGGGAQPAVPVRDSDGPASKKPKVDT